MSCEVAVVGAGMVGATLACALAQSGHEVALIDAAAPSPAAPDAPTFDARVSALSRSSEQILRSLGVWPKLPAARLGPFREMHVWDAAGSVHFDAAEVGAPALGHIVENRQVQAALDARLAELRHVRQLRPATVESLEVGTGVLLRVDGEVLRARLVVGADGTRSGVREMAGIEARVMPYGQHALVATVALELGHRETAWQRFLPRGPLAFLPLPGAHASIVWSTAPEHALELRELPAADFEAALGAAVDGRFGAIRLAGERGVFPLVHLHAARYVVERVALVGDAAHTIHPLAGQGVNLGLLDAAALAETLAAARGKGRDPGRLATLRRYERWRRGHNLLMRQLMGGFNRLFGSDLEVVRRARNAGLGAVDRVDPLKRGFMRFASGLAGDLPEMARVPP